MITPTVSDDMMAARRPPTPAPDPLTSAEQTAMAMLRGGQSFAQASAQTGVALPRLSALWNPPGVGT